MSRNNLLFKYLTNVGNWEKPEDKYINWLYPWDLYTTSWKMSWKWPRSEKKSWIAYYLVPNASFVAFSSKNRVVLSTEQFHQSFIFGQRPNCAKNFSKSYKTANLTKKSKLFFNASLLFPTSVWEWESCSHPHLFTLEFWETVLFEISIFDKNDALVKIWWNI